MNPLTSPLLHGMDTMLPLPIVPVIEWRGCYGKSWKGFVHEDSFKHPAKFSRNLIEKILRHGIERNYWQPGDLIGDPFGGVGLGGIVSTYLGFRWIGNELEPKFHATAEKNFEQHKAAWGRLGREMPRITLGDSRHFDQIISGAMTSPPYAAARIPAAGFQNQQENLRRPIDDTPYGDDPKQIDNLPPGSVSGAVTSPPYQTREDGGGIAKDGVTTTNKLGTSILSGVVSSPPYDTINAGAGGLNHKAPRSEADQGGREASDAQTEVDSRYGDADGQIAKCAKGELDGSVFSPPFATSTHVEKNPDNMTAGKAARGGDAALRVKQDYDEPTSIGQIAKLHPGELDGSVLSPPYAGTMSPAAGGADTQHPDGAKRAMHGRKDRYGVTEGQIGALTDGTVTSPPWEDRAEGGIKGSKFNFVPTQGSGHGSSEAAREAQMKRDEDKDYGTSPGQIGKTSKETYWQAMRQVYEAMYRCLKPGGVAAVVVKDYVRKKKRVLLCDDTMRLLCWIGFEPLERAHAMLVEHVDNHGPTDLLGAPTGESGQLQRKSFFRRVHEAKPGAVKIDWEETIFVRKPYEQP